VTNLTYCIESKNEYRYIMRSILSVIMNEGHVAVLTQKLPKVHVLPELEISIYRPLEAREQETG
jgi:hypothetical protein